MYWVFRYLYVNETHFLGIMGFLQRIKDKFERYVDFSELQDATEFLSDNVAKYSKTMAGIATQVKSLAKRLDDVVSRLDQIEQVLDEFAEQAQELEETQED